MKPKFIQYLKEQIEELDPFAKILLIFSTALLLFIAGFVIYKQTQNLILATATSTTGITIFLYMILRAIYEDFKEWQQTQTGGS